MNKISTEDFDRLFDEGESVMEYLDLTSVRRFNANTRRLSLDFSDSMLEALDAEAARLGVTRQALIKLWIGERLDQKR